MNLPNRFRTSRRAALGLAASAAAVALAMAAPAVLAQRKPAAVKEVAVDELMKPGPLPDVALGPANAKVTIVEYASLTCGHCANFHNKILPELKTKYVDTGKVRFILREFPLDNLAAAASMLTRCAGGDKTYPMISTLFAKQETWVVRSNPLPPLLEIAKQSGFTKESFDKCLQDQKLLDNVTAIRTRAAEQFRVNSTPTFFINGKRFEGDHSVADFDKVIEPLLKG